MGWCVYVRICMFIMAESNKTYFWSVRLKQNIFESFKSLFELFNFTCMLTYLLVIRNLVIDNKERVSQYSVINEMWFIVRGVSSLF